MKNITKKELDSILNEHKMWLRNDPEGERADLTGVNLYGAYLRGADLTGVNLYEAYLRGADLTGADLVRADLVRADLRGADLIGADLRGADLIGADLVRADLRGADLRGANLYGADLREANLRGADLRGANLYGADLREADLTGADLTGADLTGADLTGARNVPYLPMACPDEGEYTAYKKVRGNYIVVLHVPSYAKRSSALGRKCRCDKADVIRIDNLDGSMANVSTVYSSYDSNFKYTVGETVTVENFDDNRWNECAPGIHHFMNRQEAVNYIL